MTNTIYVYFKPGESRCYSQPDITQERVEALLADGYQVHTITVHRPDFPSVTTLGQVALVGGPHGDDTTDVS